METPRSSESHVNHVRTMFDALGAASADTERVWLSSTRQQRPVLPPKPPSLSSLSEGKATRRWHSPEDPSSQFYKLMSQQATTAVLLSEAEAVASSSRTPNNGNRAKCHTVTRHLSINSSSSRSLENYTKYPLCMDRRQRFVSQPQPQPKPPIPPKPLSVSSEGSSEGPEKVERRKLVSAAQEIYDKEKTFSSNIDLIACEYVRFIADYVKEKKLDIEGIADETHVIFEISKMLLKIQEAHKQLCTELYLRVTRNPLNPQLACCFSPEKVKCFGECLDFLVNKERLTNEMTRAMTDPDFKQATVEFENTYMKKLPVIAEFSIVHQNLASYQILLSNYKKYLQMYLPQDAEEAKRTEVAIAAVRDVICDVNHRLGVSLLRRRQKELAKRFHKDTFNPLQHGRMLKLEAELQKQSGADKSKGRRYLLLFSDVLLITKAARQSESKITDVLQIPVEEIHVVEEDHIERETMFQLIHNSKSRTFLATNKAERDKWVEALNGTTNSGSKCLNNGGEAGETSTTVSEADVVSPTQLPQTKVSACEVAGCDTKFGPLAKGRRCRQCNAIICEKCTKVAPIEKDFLKGGTACPQCYEAILEKFQRHELFLSSMTRKSTSCSGSSKEGLQVALSEKTNNRKDLFKQPAGGKTASDKLNNECVASGNVRLHGRVGILKERWGRLQQSDNGVLTLSLFRAEVDTSTDEVYCLSGYKYSSTELKHGARVFELRSGKNSPRTLTFRVSHPSNAERWDRVLSESLTLREDLEQDETASTSPASTLPDGRLSHSQSSSCASLTDPRNEVAEYDSDFSDF